jgi:hypothetical protein
MKFITPPKPKTKEKKPKDPIIEDGLTFDSLEELYFYWWLKELQTLGIVTTIEREPSYVLAEPLVAPIINAKGKVTTKEVMKGQQYSPDFKVVLNHESRFTYQISNYIMHKVPALPRPLWRNGGNTLIFEVKPILFGAVVAGTMQKKVSQIVRKWLWQKHGLFAQLVMIGTTEKSWFAETFTPKRFLLTDKSGKLRTLKYKPKSLVDWLNSLPE